MDTYMLESPYSGEVSVYVYDAVAPHPISNLIVRSSPLGGEINLQWSNPDIIVDYDLQSIEIYRSTTPPPQPADFALSQILSQSDLVCSGTIVSNFSDKNVVNGAIYYYFVFAKDFEDNYSVGVASDSVQAGFTFFVPFIYPPIPGLDNAFVSWQHVPNVDGYKVYYGLNTNPSDDAEAITVTIPVESLNDLLNPDTTIVNLVSGTTYFIEVGAYYLSNETGQNEVSTTIGLLPPTNFHGSYNPGQRTIDLFWEQSASNGVDRYLVYYKTDPDDNAFSGIGLQYKGDTTNSPITVMVADLTNPTNPTIDLLNGVLETPYWFKVVAVDGYGNISAPAYCRDNITPHAGYAYGLPAPTNVSAQIIQATKQVTVSWNILP